MVGGIFYGKNGEWKMSENKFRVDAEIKHPIYGYGSVVEWFGDQVVVNFDNAKVLLNGEPELILVPMAEVLKCLV